MIEYVTVRSEGNGTVPAMVVQKSLDRVLVVYASGVARVVGCSQIAPATQTEILDYIRMLANYEPMAAKAGK